MLYIIAALTMTCVSLVVFTLVTVSNGQGRAIRRQLIELQDSEPIVQKKRLDADKRKRLEALMETLGDRVMRKGDDRGGLRQLLDAAGDRKPSAPAVFYAKRIFMTVGIAAVGFALASTVGARREVIVFITIISVMIGWALPRYLLKRTVTQRKREIQLSLPDMLDMLVVCVEAGLGLNQAFLRVAQEIQPLSSVLADELQLVNLEIRAGTPRAEGLRRLGERTGSPDLRALTAVLVQTDRFGTSVAKALRVHSRTLRTKRRQRAEEAAAKTTIKLIFPLVIFIFPAMFVVILAPAILHILRQMKDLA